MKILTFPYLPKLQHYKDRNPPWVKLYAVILGPKYEFREKAAVIEYGRLVRELSDYAKLLLPYMELLAARHTPHNQLPFNAGWIAGELPSLQFAQRPRMLAATLDELLAVGLAQALDVASIKSARLTPLARESAPLDSSELLTFRGEGSGEGSEPLDALRAELPAEMQALSESLRLAVEHYGLAAAKVGWPLPRLSELGPLQQVFDLVTEEMRHVVRSDEQAFDWLLCFSRAAEQPFIHDIPGFGFSWFLRRESAETRRWNAFKVWDYGFVSRGDRGDRPCGKCADCLAGMGCSAAQRRRTSGHVLRWRESSTEPREIQLTFAFRFAGACA